MEGKTTKIDLDEIGLQTLLRGGEVPDRQQVESEKPPVDQEEEKPEDSPPPEDTQDETPPEETQGEGEQDEQSEGGDENEEDQENDGGEQEEETVFSEIDKRLGYGIDASKYEENYDGIADYIRDTATVLAQEQLSAVLESMPDVNEYFQYRINGGNPDNYFKSTQKVQRYKKEFSEEDAEMQKSILKEFYKRTGMTDEVIKTQIDDLEDTGLLAKHSKTAYEQLSAIEAKEHRAMLDQQKEQRAAAEQEAQKQWESIQSIVTSGKVNNFIIPEKDKSSFYEWLSVPVKDGMTQREMSRAEMALEEQIAVEYLIWKGLDLGKVANAINTTKKTASLRDKLKGGESGFRMNKGRQTKSTSSVQLPTQQELQQLFSQIK